LPLLHIAMGSASGQVHNSSFRSRGPTGAAGGPLRLPTIPIADLGPRFAGASSSPAIAASSSRAFGRRPLVLGAGHRRCGRDFDRRWRCRGQSQRERSARPLERGRAGTDGAKLPAPSGLAQVKRGWRLGALCDHGNAIGRADDRSEQSRRRTLRQTRRRRFDRGSVRSDRRGTAGR
jgi:hypothetical protein